MTTAQQIALKRQQLSFLRQAINQTLGPPSNKRGLGYGLIFAAFATGVMVERWGWKPLASGALSVNRWAHLAAPALGPIMAAMRD